MEILISYLALIKVNLRRKAPLRPFTNAFDGIQQTQLDNQGAGYGVDSQLQSQCHYECGYCPL